MKDLDIEKLFDSMKKNDISEVVIKDGGKLYEFRRGGFKNTAPAVQTAVAGSPVMMAASTPVINSAVAAPVTQAAEVSAPAANKNYFEVKAPLVGTFYSSGKPGAPAFVEVGTKVTKGQKLCLVEAMKNFNEIDSEVNGVIKEVLLKDGDLVEFGKVLFRIEEN